MLVKLKNLCTSSIQLRIEQKDNKIHTEKLQVEESIEVELPDEKGASLLVTVTDATLNSDSATPGILKNMGILFAYTMFDEEHATFKESLEDCRVIHIENAADDTNEEGIAEVLIMHSKNENYFCVSKDKKVRVRLRYNIKKEELKKRLRDWYIACGIEIIMYLAVLIICTVATFVNGTDYCWVFLILTIIAVGIPVMILIKKAKRDCMEIGRRRIVEKV